jgi:GT2 family glycosyltransferase
MTDPSSAPATLGVIVVNYASARLVEHNLGAIDLTGLDVRVVIVDNFASPAESAVARDLTERCDWHLVPLPDNRGFGAAVNAGVAAARALGCITFLLLNPDASVSRPVLRALHEHSLREPLALISPRIVDSGGAVYFRGSRLFLDSGRIRSGAVEPSVDVGSGAARTVPWITAACLVVHSKLLDRIGGVAEDYFLYWEDVDLSYRCLVAGGSLVVRDDLEAVHDEGGTQGRRGRAKSETYYRYNTRNRLLFAARNLGRADLLRWVLQTPMVSREILLRGGRRQLIRSPRPLMAAVRGSIAGLWLALPALLGRGPRPVDAPGPVLGEPRR